MQEGPILEFLKLVIEVCGQPLAFKKKKKKSSSDPIWGKALQSNETGERLCSWLELHLVWAVTLVISA